MSDTDSQNISEAAGDEVYEDDVERQWAEASSIEGVDPQILDDRAPGGSSGDPAAFSPWLIPFAAVMTSPLVAAVLTLFTDGDPPARRDVVAVLSTGLTAWVVNVGMASTEVQSLSARMEMSLRLGVLVASGGALLALYMFWMQGRRSVDRSGLLRSAVLLFVLSGIFWFGYLTEPSWWAWMGR